KHIAYSRCLWKQCSESSSHSVYVTDGVSDVLHQLKRRLQSEHVARSARWSNQSSGFTDGPDLAADDVREIRPAQPDKCSACTGNACDVQGSKCWPKKLPTGRSIPELTARTDVHDSPIL